MKRRPEEILGEWGVRDVTPPSQHERNRLELDRDVNPLVGLPIRRRLRNFRAEPDTYLASLGGPLPYMRRLRQIEEEVDVHLARLTEAYSEHRGDPASWRGVAERWDFSEVNELIARHNRWYPAEARLRMDPRTGDFAQVNGEDFRLRPLDVDWALERFPARLPRAAAA